MSRLGDWFEERTGYRGVVAVALDEPVRGGASFAYVFGSVLTFTLLLQMVTGVLLAAYYSPSASAAWASVAYIQDEVTVGWFIRGLHHIGASTMVIVSGLHLMQVAIYGAYKKPREVNWLTGAVMLAVVLAFALTGYLLPWDQKGYWATKVATGIMGSTPVIGPWLQNLVQGGNEYGNLTLTRFYAVHVFILPATILLLLAVHIALFRKHGVTPKWGRSEAELDATAQTFWPHQLLRDMLAIAVCFAAMVFVTWREHGAPLAAPADPASAYDARPEWYFLPLFQMLKYFHGFMEQVAALGAPLVVGAVLFGLPFLDRGVDRSPRRRLAFLGTLGLGFVAAASLTFTAMRSDAGDAGLQKRLHAAELQADKARKLALVGVPPAGGTAVYENDPNFRGQRLFAERCAGCHSGDDRKGPEIIGGYNSRDWIRDYLLDPDGHRFYGVTKAIHKMKPVKHRGDELDALVEMLYAESGAADARADLVERGRSLFDGGSCSDCHSRDGETAGDEGPNLGRRGSREWLMAFISQPGHPRFFGEKNEMTAFGEKLREEEIGLLADYVRFLRAESAGP